ncbi:NAD(P)H-quinone oxidoreductase subunit U, chloroplastic isoform X2 [Diospyros lotus]|uniref:NAD(P)H-quinone oxidoreductase subunit U, chloroplastic isoform X2 n=1 Tax=Diospyros lotus TaxID=55363 RepID=UPI00224D1F46|nr:NAD(P)H-quinone oxidoreductase subunit U, chloroplastic isoform X2 [Diospyros lotus]
MPVLSSPTAPLRMRGQNAATTAQSRRRRRSSSQPNFIKIRSSSDASAGTAAQDEEETGKETSTTPLQQVSQESSSSVISALNVERALRGIPITDIDHYGRLGIQRGCSYDQVYAAYKSKADELKRQGLEEEVMNQKLELLLESYSVLSNGKERRLYDWSLARSEKPDRYVWPFEVDITRKSTDASPPPQEAEDVGPTRLVGYFMLGWYYF